MSPVFNPYLPSYEYVPDGEPHIFNNRLYIYGSHDRFNGTTYCENDYVCWSAPIDDLSDWRFEGEIYNRRQHPHHEEHMILFAPDVVQGADKRYYLYYSVAHSSRMSVAVCDTPAGHYEYLGDVKTKEGRIYGLQHDDFAQFDPGVFMDDDKSIYLYSGFCPKKTEDEYGRIMQGAFVCRLMPDMMTMYELPHLIIPRNFKCPDNAGFFEASSMRKINGTYYFIYSARVNGLHYATSQYPDRDFIYGGRIHSTSDIGLRGYTIDNPAYPNGNIHGSVIDINGQYYIFDHRFTNNTSFCRQGVAEKIYIEKNGHISQAEATSCGLSDKPLPAYGLYPAYITCHIRNLNTIPDMDKEEKLSIMPYITQDGEDRESGDNQYIKNIQDKSIIGFKYFDFSGDNTPSDISNTINNTANNTITLRLVISGTANGIISITTDTDYADKSFDDYNVCAHKHINISSRTKYTVTMTFERPSGTLPLYFLFNGEGDFCLYTFEFL